MNQSQKKTQSNVFFNPKTGKLEIAKSEDYEESKTSTNTKTQQTHDIETQQNTKKRRKEIQTPQTPQTSQREKLVLNGVYSTHINSKKYEELGFESTKDKVMNFLWYLNKYYILCKETRIEIKTGKATIHRKSRTQPSKYCLHVSLLNYPDVNFALFNNKSYGY